MLTEWIDPNVLSLSLSLVVLAAMVFVAGYFIRKTRPRPVQQEPEVSELLSKYREMHSRGELSDTEFRTIKSKLIERFQDELKDDGDTG